MWHLFFLSVCVWLRAASVVVVYVVWGLPNILQLAGAWSDKKNPVTSCRSRCKRPMGVLRIIIVPITNSNIVGKKKLNY